MNKNELEIIKDTYGYKQLELEMLGLILNTNL